MQRHICHFRKLSYNTLNINNEHLSICTHSRKMYMCVWFTAEREGWEQCNHGNSSDLSPWGTQRPGGTGAIRPHVQTAKNQVGLHTGTQIYKHTHIQSSFHSPQTNICIVILLYRVMWDWPWGSFMGMILVKPPSLDLRRLISASRTCANSSLCLRSGWMMQVTITNHCMMLYILWDWMWIIQMLDLWS